MQQLYHIIVTPYGYDYWSIYTEDKTLFDMIRQYGDTDELIDDIGEDHWEDIADAWMDIKYPHVILGEYQLRQPD